MKIARVTHNNLPIWVEIIDDKVFALKGSPFDGVRGECLGQFEEAALLAPIEPHNKIIGLMDNYFNERGTRRGAGMNVLPYSSVIPYGADIIAPPDVTRVGFENELAIVIGQTAKNVPIEYALNHVFGYTIINDVTSFSVLEEDQLDFLGRLAAVSMRFKLYDAFAPLGPWIVTGIDGGALHLTTRVDGVVRQDSSTSTMTFGIAETVAWVSSVMTLNPGDVIGTGTPAGYGDVEPGAVIECEIENIGILRNRYVKIFPH